MASAMVGVRFVRCPKCVKVLAEFGQVPVYRCGGCGTVLRAKARAASTAETTFRGSLENDSQSPTEDHHRVLDSSSGVIAEDLPERVNQVGEKMESSLHNLSLNEEEEEEKSSCHADDNDAADDAKFTSLAYDASDSSRDEQPLSRRRFRQERASSSKDGSAEKGTQPQPQPQPQPRELPNAARRGGSLERDTTFGSDDFHSVQNWMGSEIGDEDLITLSKDLLLRSANPPTKAGYSEPDHVKILRKVDELRDELAEFLTKKPSEGKPRATQFPPPRVPKVPTQDGEKRGKEAQKKKKQQAIKQYFRPVCGGAPFVICYKCWTLLQVPADFLVSGKTLHRLRCGACSETLVFSFRPRVRGADPPRTPTEAQHPPSEADRHDDGFAGGGLRSYYSSSSSSYELNEPMRNVSRSSSYSTKRLHRLMGYNSASDVLFRQGGGRADDDDDGGNDGSETSTPQFYRPPRGDRRRRYGEYGGAGSSTPKSPEIQEVEEPAAAAPTTPRRRGGALGILKKGVREFSHGLENVKLKVQSRG